MISKEILEDLTRDCPCNKSEESNWCFLKEIIGSFGLGDRNAEQIRLVYDYKFMESQKEDNDIGKERAFTEFISLYGKRFDEVYKEGMKNGELFELVFGFKKAHTDEDVREHITNN